MQPRTHGPDSRRANEPAEPDAIDIAENSYGVRKRLEFVSAVVARWVPRRILDVGCGTGSLLTFPLAARYPRLTVVGVDVHRPSIEFAREHYVLPNLSFACLDEIPSGEVFDLIIASEVIEHVNEPGAFLLFLRSRLAQNGKMVLTLPNGYGPFEMASLVEDVLHLSGVYRLLSRAKRRLFRNRESGVAGKRDTLAVDPHVNFFSHQEAWRLIDSAGLRVVQYRPRTFLCGFGFDTIVRGEQLIAWNASVADQLPPALASAWMYLLETGAKPTAAPGYTRVVYARLHRYLNLKRWERNRVG